MLLLLLVITILCTPVILQARPPSCGDVCYYDGQYQIADCSGIGLHEVPTSDGCDSVRLLDLSYNDIASLQENDMIGNRGAKHLDLSFNSISNVEPRSFSGSNNVIYLNLYLSSNQIVVLRNETFTGGEKSLQQLHLDGNKIAVIENGAFKSLTRLGHLFLGHNNLQNLEPTVFQDLVVLESLYLNSNRLLSLHGKLFSALIRLKHLDLSSNNLFILGDEIFNQPCNLMTVVLSNNRLRNIPNPSRSASLNTLQALDIRSNNITDATNITSYIYVVEKLLIDENPFHCDCNLETVRQWVQQEVTYSELQCIMPVSGESIEIRNLTALCPTNFPKTTVIQPTSRQKEQRDVLQNAARPENGNKPKLPMYSSNVLAEKILSQGGSDEDAKSVGGKSESLDTERGGSSSANSKKFLLLLIAPASVIIAFLAILIIYKYCKSSKQRKDTTPRKNQITPDKSTPKDSWIDIPGVRRRTPQSDDKMMSNESPGNNSKRDHNVSTTGSEHVRLQGGRDSGRKNVPKCKLQNQYVTSLSEITENGGEWDDLGIMPLSK